MRMIIILCLSLLGCTAAKHDESFLKRVDNNCTLTLPDGTVLECRFNARSTGEEADVGEQGEGTFENILDLRETINTGP